ncbi:type II toxin-antitoxin system VapC family toxin [Turneriella parva]|uniref:Uncharacterized protein n=1 Tax=Turneriella parva (strain ATCC BAA-1111 / DSM 21527 / NCTC 11395 / H) TaxID=869212 RepID=I4B5F2_TURPD|nr:type II toxin-antitoxin system VapC family toxin [Turneriella parva]AFM12509.1 hypothetical protein Turpa_1862 [Turneriella parva DSM 21527]
MNRVYLDTSAYLAVLLGEKQAASVTKKLSNRVLCSSTLLLIEAERNLVHLVRLEKISTLDFESAYTQIRKDQEAFLLRDFTPDLCLTRHFPLIRTPKSADMVHLRTAQWFMKNGGLEEFISLDENQLQAARELGLPVN